MLRPGRAKPIATNSRAMPTIHHLLPRASFAALAWMTGAVAATAAEAQAGAPSPGVPAWVKDVSATHPDLNGTWKLDKAQSQLSGRMNVNQADLEQTMTITLKAGEFTVVTKTTGGPRHEVSSTEIYALDGKPRAFTPAGRTGSAQAKGTRLAKWSEDGQQILIAEEITRDMNSGVFTVHNTHTWSLSDDGKTLKIVSVIRGPSGEIPTVRVLTRQ